MRARQTSPNLSRTLALPPGALAEGLGYTLILGLAPLGRQAWTSIRPRRESTMPHLFLILTIFAYSLSFVSYLRFLYTGWVVSGRIASGLLAVGLVTHYFALLE